MLDDFGGPAPFGRASPGTKANQLNRPHSPFLPYPDQYPWNDGQMQQRVSIVVHALSDASVRGAAARKALQEYTQH